MSLMNDLIQFLTDNPELTNAYATIATAFIALAAVFLSYRTVQLQQTHNVLSVKPLPHVAVADYEERLTVRIDNNGPGPLIVNSVEVENGSQTKDSVIDWMPDLPTGIYWDTFLGKVNARSVPPGGQIILLQLNGDPSEPRFMEARDMCRAILSELTVVIKYTDIYGSKISTYRTDLSWFGRLLTNDSTIQE